MNDSKTQHRLTRKVVIERHGGRCSNGIVGFRSGKTVSGAGRCDPWLEGERSDDDLPSEW